MQRDHSSPQAYRAAVSGEQSQLLEAIRTLIFELSPEIDEEIEYGMLSYPGLASLAAQKHYVSLYVMPAVLAAHRESFAGISMGKSCLRFRSLAQLDPTLLRPLLMDVLRERAEEASAG